MGDVFGSKPRSSERRHRILNDMGRKCCEFGSEWCVRVIEYVNHHTHKTWVTAKFGVCARVSWAKQKESRSRGNRGQKQGQKGCISFLLFISSIICRHIHLQTYSSTLLRHMKASLALLGILPVLTYSMQWPFHRPNRPVGDPIEPVPVGHQQVQQDQQNQQAQEQSSMLRPYTTAWVNELQLIYNKFGEIRNDFSCPTEIQDWNCTPYPLSEKDLARPKDVWHLRPHVCATLSSPTSIYPSQFQGHDSVSKLTTFDLIFAILFIFSRTSKPSYPSETASQRDLPWFLRVLLSRLCSSSVGRCFLVAGMMASTPLPIFYAPTPSTSQAAPPVLHSP